jgi:hypothetical protein
MRRIYLSELTPAQRRAICNGVGPAFAEMIFRPLWKQWQTFEPNKMFAMIACQHDVDYWVGGGITEKLAADFAFLTGCLQIATRHQGARKLLLCLLALAYGLAVISILGWPAWHFGRQRTREHLKEIAP